MTGKLTLRTVNNQNGSTLYQVHVFGELPNGATAFGLWCPPGNAEQEAIAKRLVACWNLCDGVSTEQVEDAPGLERLLAERAEMLRVVQMANELCEAVGIKCPSGSEDAFADLWQASGNVIAKVDGAYLCGATQAKRC